MGQGPHTSDSAAACSPAQGAAHAAQMSFDQGLQGVALSQAGGCKMPAASGSPMDCWWRTFQLDLPCSQTLLMLLAFGVFLGLPTDSNLFEGLT